MEDTSIDTLHDGNIDSYCNVIGNEDCSFKIY